MSDLMRLDIVGLCAVWFGLLCQAFVSLDNQNVGQRRSVAASQRRRIMLGCCVIVLGARRLAFDRCLVLAEFGGSSAGARRALVI